MPSTTRSDEDMTPSSGSSIERGVEEHDVVVIGAGFAGLGAAIRLMQAGRDDFVVLEGASGVGGTWRANSYPGCACDVPSNLYSFSFALKPDWSRSFSPQPEIEAYLQDCTERFGVLDKIRFRHSVQRASWDTDARRWTVETDQQTFRCRVLVSGTGLLSEPRLPDIPGRDTFTGVALHTGAWDPTVDLTGMRIAVIGTGASSVQVIPELVKIAAHVDVYQRTPAWVIPRSDRSVTRLEHLIYRHVPGVQRAVRGGIYWSREALVVAFTRRIALLRLVQRLAARHLERQVPDEALRAKLTPDYVLGCKRILISNDYYPALGRPDVEVITDGIAAITPSGVVTVDGTERPVDALVFGTGFHATDLPTAQRIVGRDERALSDVWSNGMEAYLGTTVAGFPNLFLIVGPNTGLGHSSMVVMIEAEVDYVIDALAQMDAHAIETVEVRHEVQASANDEIQELLAPSVWNTGGCASWYLDERGRNTTLWPTFTSTFRHRTRRFDLGSYRQETRRVGAAR